MITNYLSKTTNNVDVVKGINESTNEKQKTNSKDFLRKKRSRNEEKRKVLNNNSSNNHQRTKLSDSKRDLNNNNNNTLNMNVNNANNINNIIPNMTFSPCNTYQFPTSPFVIGNNLFDYSKSKTNTEKKQIESDSIQINDIDKNSNIINSNNNSSSNQNNNGATNMKSSTLSFNNNLLKNSLTFDNDRFNCLNNLTPGNIINFYNLNQSFPCSPIAYNRLDSSLELNGKKNKI